MTKHRVKFTSGELLEVSNDSNLSECSDITNSPILFGCRTGICSTCLVEVKQGIDQITAPTSDEKELLEIIAPGNSNARLACQFKIQGDIEVEFLGK